MAKNNHTTTAASWAAIATVDLATVGGPAFGEAVAKIDAEAKRLRAEGKLPDFPVTTGKRRFTPEDAEKALLHNGGNRKVGLTHVQEISSLMQNGGWKLAQPILFDENGDLLDGQHRLLAAYFSGLTVDLMVMVVPTEPDLFAIIDSGRGRRAGDALYTAGMNGASAVTAAAAKLLHRYEHQQIGIFKQPKGLLKLPNIEVLRYARSHPEIGEAAHEVLDDYPSAVSIIGDKGVAVAFGYLVNQHYEDGVLHDFFTALAVTDDLAKDDPIFALRARFEAAAAKTGEKLRKERKLALLIKGFLLDAAGQKVGKNGVHMRDNEKFPRIEEAVKETEDALV
jgi:hypothetical protein